MKITLSFPVCGTDIPYFDPDEFTPQDRHEYVDLRANPGGVHDLPEVLLAPQLKEFLLVINGADTIFSTFGCNYVLFPEETVEAENYAKTITTAEAHSYVHVGFADLARCKCQDDYYRLCGRLGKHLYEHADFQSKTGDAAEPADAEANGAAPVEVFHVDLSIESLRIDGQDQGHVLAISCHVQGWTEDEARTRWSQLMGVVSAYLAMERLA